MSAKLAGLFSNTLDINDFCRCSVLADRDLDARPDHRIRQAGAYDFLARIDGLDLRPGAGRL